MNPEPLHIIRILIADDSVVNRQRLRQCLEQEPLFQVVAVAADGRQALEKIERHQPDLVILDIEMPELDGLEVLVQIRTDYGSLPVIMFSSLTEAGAAMTLRALALGADDYVTKPSASFGQETDATMLEAFRSRIFALHRALKRSESYMPPLAVMSDHSPVLGLQVRPKVIGIGVSTGGPKALEVLLSGLPAQFSVPVLIVQHMPPMFTRFLAERLDALVPLRVVEAEAGMLLQTGTVYIAPGNQHLLVKAEPEPRLSLSQAPPENSCRPSVDVLFYSLAECFGRACLGVVMTGMGHDGLKGSENIHRVGGRILAQDEATSTVWGMPGAVVKARLADKVLPLEAIAGELLRCSSRPL